VALVDRREAQQFGAVGEALGEFGRAAMHAAVESRQKTERDEALDVERRLLPLSAAGPR
jgi:hypothetical protein